MLLRLVRRQTTVEQPQLVLLQQEPAQCYSKLAKLQLVRHGLQEYSQNRRDNSQQRLIVIGVSKTPRLDQVRETSRLVAFVSTRDLRVAARFEQLELLGFLALCLGLSDREEVFFEFVDA